MKKSGKICAKALKKVLDQIKPGVTCSMLDQIASREIEARGASSSFMTVENYKWTICTTINNQVVHGIPTNIMLKEGDIVGVDIGALYNLYHSDMAQTVPVGKIDNSLKQFLDTGAKTLQYAINQAKVGNHIGDISETIQKEVESKGYSIVKNLTGHGVGRELHEEPAVPGFGRRGVGQIIREGMTLAIEVIYTMGSGEIILEKDGWTISSEDGSIAALFEQTIAVSDSGPIVLTPYL